MDKSDTETTLCVILGAAVIFLLLAIAASIVLSPASIPLSHPARFVEISDAGEAAGGVP